jgi:hypothetical protein
MKGDVEKKSSVILAVNQLIEFIDFFKAQSRGE